MLKSLVLGTILGGLVAFAWSTVSWEVIGWHEKTMLNFHNDDEVGAIIASHAPSDGTYLLPGELPTQGMTPDQKKNANDALMARMTRGPIVVAAVRVGGFPSFGRAILLQVLSLLAVAFVLTWLLLQTSGLSYTRRVAFLAVAGLAGGLIVDLPNWNWWGFSGAYTAVDIANSVITWMLAGLAIAAVAGKSVTCNKSEPAV
ncbi:MAG TPA: hypothetical protein VN862_06635 [Candidatus Acidoferrales bacterium]|nr:hypothetical protein [Candidatus Acidoferrales bacterium]